MSSRFFKEDTEGEEKFLYIKTDADGYLIWLEGARWDGSSMYKLIDHPIDSCIELMQRGYECNIRVVKASRRHKYVQTIETSHDRPTGYRGHIIALSLEELKRAQQIFKKFPCGSPRFNEGIMRLFRGYVNI